MLLPLLSSGASDVWKMWNSLAVTTVRKTSEAMELEGRHAVTAVDITIRRARSLEDFEAALAIQKDVWAFTEPAGYASVPLMRVADRFGGCLLVAEGSDGSIRGFAYSLFCREGRESPFWWSHMTAVSSDLQDSGVGFRLKLAQREEALREGISQIRWTFDPLRTKNAHFNVRKLGAVASSYEENLYGLSSSPLHKGLPTDRLHASWELQSSRVVDRIGGTGSLILRDFDGIVRILECRAGQPGRPSLGHEETPLLVEVPLDYPPSAGADRGAAAWLHAFRTLFPHYQKKGYQVTDFILVETSPAQAFYVLDR